MITLKAKDLVQTFKIQSNSLINDDCLNAMKYIPDSSISMILTDSPYGTTNCKWDSVVPLDLMWKEFERVIKPNGTILMCAQSPFDKVLAVSNLNLFRYEWIWEKTSATGHLNAKKMPLKAHENILVFYKKLPTYNPQKTKGHERKVCSAKTKAKSSKRGESRDSVYQNDVIDNLVDYDSTERYPRSVQVFAKDTQKSKLHPTQKPVALMEYFIKTYTNSGDTVLDPFMGSGTTGVACKNLVRDFIGIELDKEHFNTAVNRIEKVD